MAILEVGFSKPKSKLAVVSFLVRLFERSEFSHVFISWKSSKLDRQMIYHASHGMVHFLSGERFYSKNTVVVTYDLDLNDEIFKKVLQKCVDLAGTRYGYLELIGIGFERLTGMRSPFRDGMHTYVCSELIGEVLKQVDPDISNLDLELIGPKELEEHIKCYINQVIT